nr:hypothetical protein [Clostridioides difficile]
ALKDIDRDIKVYIKNIIDSETIIRLIYDITIMSIGTFGYRYKISTENLNTLITVNEIDDLIHNRTSNTKDEEFVLEVYKYFREDIRDDWDEASLLCSNEISLNL